MKSLVLTAALFCLSYGAFAQTPTNYFEVFTKSAYSHGSSNHFMLNKDSILSRIHNIPDSASNLATFVVGAPDASNIDSVFLTLTNSLGQTVYTTSVPYSSITASPDFHVTNDVLYYTVGPYQYLKHFTATARIKYTTGGSSNVRTFTKN